MADPAPDDEDNSGMPQWVKVSAIVGCMLALLVVILLLSGHGPWRHLSGSGKPPLQFATAPPYLFTSNRA